MLMRVVVDTSVIVAGFASGRGASRRLLLAALDGKVRLLFSTPLLVEYEAVLTRPAMLAMSGVSVEEVGPTGDGRRQDCHRPLPWGQTYVVS